MNKAVVICHGDMAKGLVSAATKIYGETGIFFAVTNTDKGLPDLLNEVKQILSDNSIEIPVFFADMRGGSCWRISMQIIKELKKGIVFSGVNLPMLVNYAAKINDLNSIEELKDILIESTCKSVIGET